MINTIVIERIKSVVFAKLNMQEEIELFKRNQFNTSRK